MKSKFRRNYRSGTFIRRTQVFNWFDAGAWVKVG